jgi:hypothetical protein
MFQTKFVEKIKTHILFLITFFENRAVYEIMWENIVEPWWPQMAIWRTRIACWITKATDTLSICNTYCFSTATMVTRTLPVLKFLSPKNAPLYYTYKLKLNSVALVCERTIPTERPPPVGEVSANFCG